MTKNIQFDFYRIHTYKSFYRICKQKLQLPDFFGENLDALWDCLTGYIELPVSIQFENVSSFQLKKFEKLISLLKEAEKELEGRLSFKCYSKEDEDVLG
jgi:ribonuclease inhibitor